MTHITYFIFSHILSWHCLLKLIKCAKLKLACILFEGGDIMDFRKKIQDKIKKQVEKIGEIEIKLREEKIYLKALQDTLKLVPGSNGNAELRTGSLVALARESLRKVGKPMHVREILKDMEKEATRNNRVSLSGSIGGYIRRNQIFTKIAPNTFGLKEFDNKEDEELKEGILKDL